MELEDAIRQSEFRSDNHKAVLNLLHTTAFLSSVISTITTRVGITRQQFNVLRILRGQYPKAASINLIRERMLERMPDSSRMVDRLAAKGLISKSSCPHDRRAAEVTITDKGLQLLEQLDPAVHSADNFLGRLTGEEVGILNRLLDKIRA